MKFKFLDPDQVMNVIVSLIILAVGIFAFFVTVSNVPTSAPVSNRAFVSANHTIVNPDTYEYVTVSAIATNLTTNCVLTGHHGVTGWATLQAAGTVNGTFIDTNDTFRFAPGTTHTAQAYVFYNFTYQVVATPSTDLSNSTYWAILNASQTGNSVFNIVGVVLILSAIMMIVGMVYSYVGPRRQ